MATWEGIEDSSPYPERVWFARVKDSESWNPLRKCDCKVINETVKAGKNTALIGFGRATVDLDADIIRYNFYNAPVRQLCSAAWFVKDYKSEKDVKLVPIRSTLDEMLIEELYVQSKAEATSNGSIDARAEVLLKDDEGYKVFLMKVGNTLSLRKKTVSMISLLLDGSSELQRGYGEYTVDGEEEEIALGPVRHLSFVIHGIGEAMWRRQDVMIPGVIESVEVMRAAINKKMYGSWKQDCQRCQKRR